MISILHNKKEFEEFYFYNGEIESKEYPNQYPCLCKKIFHDGGINGDYVEHKIMYPHNCYVSRDMRLCFLAGLKEGMESQSLIDQRIS